MTYQELKDKYNRKQSRRPKDNEEHRLQSACVKWFRLKYPALKNIMFAIPNAARRSPITGAYMKNEGMLAGVADLILLKSNAHYGALCIEMKIPGGSQSPNQKRWQKECEAIGNKYVICRSLDEFINEVTNYLNDKL